MSKEKYISAIEITNGQAKSNCEIAVYCKAGKVPSIGDLVEAIHKECGIEVEIVDFITMTFGPVDRTATTILSIRIVRTYKDVTFNKKIRYY